MLKQLAALAVAVLVAGVPAVAGAETVTRHRTYETAVTNGFPGGWLLVDCAPGYGPASDDCDPSGATEDGSVDVGGVVIPADGTADGATEVQVRIVDDVWGAGAVAGYVCALGFAHDSCAEQQSGFELFCGESSPVSPHTGEIKEVHVTVLGTWWQVVACDPAMAPTGGTSGGVINPAAGIYAEFGVPGST